MLSDGLGLAMGLGHDNLALGRLLLVQGRPVGGLGLSSLGGLLFVALGRLVRRPLGLGLLLGATCRGALLVLLLAMVPLAPTWRHHRRLERNGLGAMERLARLLPTRILCLSPIHLLILLLLLLPLLAITVSTILAV